jgi:hypothetical protein
MNADKCGYMKSAFIRVNFGLESSGAAHSAVIARFAAGLDAAGFFVLKEVDELGDSGFFNAESFKAGMTRAHSSQPW